MQVIRAIADNKMECKRAGLLLYALQTASYNLKRASLEPDMFEVVRDTSSLAQEVTLPRDPVDALRAMRRTYWKLRDPDLLKRDREMVAADCASFKSAAAPPSPLTRSPDRPITGSPADTQSGLRSPDRPITGSPDDTDPVLKFISEMNRSLNPPATR